MKVAGWSNSGTFTTFYHKPIDNTANFGNMVLQQQSKADDTFGFDA